jgi:hypothetical protein
LEMHLLTFGFTIIFEEDTICASSIKKAQNFMIIRYKSKSW